MKINECLLLIATKNKIHGLDALMREIGLTISFKRK